MTTVIKRSGFFLCFVAWIQLLTFVDIITLAKKIENLETLCYIFVFSHDFGFESDRLKFLQPTL